MSTTLTAGVYQPIIGTYEQAIAYVGRRSARLRSVFPVSESSVRMYCGMIEDRNAVYWDNSVAKQLHGGPVAPAALLQSVLMMLPWRPDGDPAGALPLMMFTVPLPGHTLINVSTESAHHRPHLVDVPVYFWDEVIEVSPLRSTRLGPGHFLTTKLYCENEAGIPIAEITNVMLRFDQVAA